MGRSGHFFAVQAWSIEPDLLTSAKSLGGGVPCGALLASEALTKTLTSGDLGTTFGGGPMAAAAIVAVIDTIQEEGLLQNVRDREAEIRDSCVVGPIQKIQGMGLLLGLICDRPAREVRDALLEHDVLAGLSADPHSLRILAPLVIESAHVQHLADALATIPPAAH
jgi:acetylornithine/succinyldiaminopimelate/putrescine aminotransferase